MQDLFTGLSNWMVIVLLFLISVILGYILIKLQNLRQKISSNIKGKKPSLLSVLVIVLLVCSASLLIYILFYLFHFHSYTEGQLIAIVTCEKPADAHANFNLRLRLSSSESESENYRINGEKWFIKGEILTWNRILRSIGLNELYRFTELAGYYSSANSSSSHRLVRDEDSKIWNFIYKSNRWMPLLSIHPVKTAYILPVYNKSHGIYTSSVEFIVKSSATLQPKINAEEIENESREESIPYPRNEKDIKK